MLNFKGYEWVFWEGLKVTLSVGLSCIPVVIVMGLLGAWAKLSGNKIARSIGYTYTTIVRGVPELVLILLVYFGITDLLQQLLSALTGTEVLIDVDRFTAGTITLGLIYGAFATEVFRGAYLAVDRGQIEAAHAFGMHKRLAFIRIVFPQMMRFAIPGLGNVWMVLMKATSLMSVIQLPDDPAGAGAGAGAVPSAR